MFEVWGSLQMAEIPTTDYRELINFICEANEYSNFLHTTNIVEKAKSICENGFQFKNFNKTTDYVCDRDSLAYLLNMRKAYGNFTVIIQISNKITNCEAICEKEYDEEGEEVFILPPKYIKGYYDRITNEIFANPLFKK
jgi:hypothetical protein